jgi:hypothetical protein
MVKALEKETPDSPKTWRNVDRWPDAAAKNRAYAVYEALDALVPETCGATAPDDGAAQSVVSTTKNRTIFALLRSLPHYL